MLLKFEDHRQFDSLPFRSRPIRRAAKAGKCLPAGSTSDCLGDLRPFVNSREQENMFVKRCQSGDAGAWDSLIARHTGRVYGMCYRFTRSECDARDVTQEVFLRVFRTLGSFRADELSFVAWLNLLTLNLLRDHYRRSRKERATVSIDVHRGWAESFPNASRRPDQLFCVEEARSIMHSALAKLPPELKDIVILYDVQELQYHEISGRLGIPIGTVKSRLNRARRKLARFLAPHKRAA
jgi:RNA polymerase sigma-70 factor (ECF subfamily)